MLELAFPVTGDRIPAEHGYLLYAAVSTLIPDLHNGSIPYQLGLISGDRLGPGELKLTIRSNIRLRVAADHLPKLLPLAGKPLTLAGLKLRVGVPRVHALESPASLAARIVTIKGFKEPTPFLEAVRRQLDALEIAGQPAIPLTRAGPRAGQPIRRILKIRDKKVVGFALHVTALTAPESLRLQEHSLGGRQHMGAGFFVPISSSNR